MRREGLNGEERRVEEKIRDENKREERRKKRGKDKMREKSTKKNATVSILRGYIRVRFGACKGF